MTKKKENATKQITQGVIIILGLLLIISVVQAGQINALSKGTNNEKTVVKTAEKQQTGQQGITQKTTAPTSKPATVPAMVGGC